MKKVVINVPDDCEVQVVGKEEEKEVIRTYQDLIKAGKTITGYYLGTNGGLMPYDTTASELDTNIASSKKK